MPLERRHFGDLDEQPLACSVLEAGLIDAELHRAAGVNEDLG